MSTANGATPYQPDGGISPHHPYPQTPQQAPYPYPPMARPATPRQPGASRGYPDLPTRPAQRTLVQSAPAVDKVGMPRAAKAAAPPRMPKAQALEKARALKKMILGVTLGSFVAFATLAATHLNTSSSSASASASSNSSSAASGSSASSSSRSDDGSSSSGFGFGSNSSQAPVSGSSSS